MDFDIHDFDIQSLAPALSLVLICLIYLYTALVARLTAIQPGRLLDEERRSSWSLTRTIPTHFFFVVLRRLWNQSIHCSAALVAYLMRSCWLV